MPVKETKDGRLVLTGRHYTEHRRSVYDSQGGKCLACDARISFDYFELDHVSGRGMGGGKRDDRQVEGLCRGCHRYRHETGYHQKRREAERVTP